MGDIIDSRDPLSHRGRAAPLATTVMVVGIMTIIVAGLGALMLMAYLSRPIADDYSALVAVNRNGLGSFWNDYSTLSGRYTNIVIYAYSYLALGARALWAVPLVLTAVLLIALGYLGHRSVALTGSRRSMTGAVVGVGTGVAAIALQPSVYDIFVWYTSSTLYLASLAAVAAAAALTLAALCASGRNRIVLSALAAVAVFALEGLSETSATYVVGIAIVALVFSLTVFRSRLAASRTIIAVMTVVAIAGLLVSSLAPGRSGRVAVQTIGQSVGIGPIIISSLQDVGALLAHFATLRSLGLVALGLLLGHVLPSLRFRTRVIIVAGAAMATFSASFITNALVLYGYNGGAIPLRALAFPTMILAVAVVISTAAVVAGVASRGALSSSLVAALVLVCSAGFLFGWKGEATRLVEAESLRASLFDARGFDVAHQVAEKKTVIAITPLPILVLDTETTDYLIPGSSGPAWTEPGIRAYYGISGLKSQATEQPRTYCLPDFVNTYWNIKSCQELVTR